MKRVIKILEMNKNMAKVMTKWGKENKRIGIKFKPTKVKINGNLNTQIIIIKTNSNRMKVLLLRNIVSKYKKIIIIKLTFNEFYSL